MEQINEKNFNFYNRIGLDTFQALAKDGGFSTFVDLEIAYRYIQPTENIAEIGAGYGRCIDFLLAKKHQGKIIAVEQSPKLCEHLRAVYSSNIKIVEGDIYKVSFDHQIDAALWMWSGMIDFSVEEQAAVIKHIHELLTQKGKLFIDIPRIGIKTIADHIDQQRIKLTTDFGEIECYIPLSSEVKEYADAAGFTRVDEINYETATDKKRTMYILMK
jgi:precorrin-6B methylase 2